MGGDASAQAEDPAPPKWVRYGIELKSRHDCEAERSNLSHDPVAGRPNEAGPLRGKPSSRKTLNLSLPFMLRNGLHYDKPVSFMREYLKGIKAAPYKAPAPASDPPVVIAGLLPKMLQVGAEYSNGIITALMPPAQIAKMRQLLGPSKWLLAQQMVMLESDGAKARGAVREFMRFYLNAPPYQRNFKLMGFDENDFRGGGSDRLIDAIIAWGDERQLRERIGEHYRAGADHLYRIPLAADDGRRP